VAPTVSCGSSPAGALYESAVYYPAKQRMIGLGGQDGFSGTIWGRLGFSQTQMGWESRPHGLSCYRQEGATGPVWSQGSLRFHHQPNDRVRWQTQATKLQTNAVWALTNANGLGGNSGLGST